MKRRRKLDKVYKEFNERTAGYKGEDIWELSDYLALLNIADSDGLGKSKAIIYAYKIGFLNGKSSTLDKIREYLDRKDGLIV